MTGTIKKLLEGYGFLTDQTGVDRFFHATSTEDFRSLQEGDEVRFEAVESKRGPRAEKVVVLQKAVR